MKHFKKLFVLCTIILSVVFSACSNSENVDSSKSNSKLSNASSYSLCGDSSVEDSSWTSSSTESSTQTVVNSISDSISTSSFSSFQTSQSEGSSEQSISSSSSSIQSSISSLIVPEAYFTVNIDGYIQKVKNGETAIEPNLPNRENYEFLGWYEGDNPFSFDTLIDRDYYIVSKWEEKEVQLPQATQIHSLLGNFLLDGDEFVTSEDYSIGVIQGGELINGEFKITFSGAGNHGIYFRLYTDGVYRGKPTGNYYSLNVDGFGNLTLEKAINGAREVLSLSHSIKGDFDPNNYYTFKVQVLDNMIRVFHNNLLIITYTDSNAPFGNQIAIYSEKSGTRFNVVEIKSENGFLCADNKLIWSDEENSDGYELKIDDLTQTISNQTRFVDLTTLNISSGIHQLQLFRVIGTEKTCIVQTEYIVEGIPTDINVYSGQWSSFGYDYFSKQPKSLALLKDKEVSDGTISSTIIPGTPNDCGLVFRCSTSLTSFWEEVGASYYTALINSQGILLLGKVNCNGVVWSTLAEGVIANFSPSNAYLMQVNLNKARIIVSVNGQRLIDYTDTNYFTGTGVGFRSASAGVRVSAVEIGETYYSLDLSSVNTNTNLPNNWIRYGNGAKPTISTTSQGVSFSTTDIVANSVQFENTTFNKQNYTIEMKMQITSSPDLNRWFGITVRGAKNQGYVRTWFTIDGRTGVNTQSNYLLGNGTDVVNGPNTTGKTLSQFAYNQTIALRVTVKDNQLYYFINGVNVLNYALTENYNAGAFGFTFGGGNYLIQDVVARSVVASDISIL